jgi:hypothetical protein
MRRAVADVFDGHRDTAVRLLALFEPVEPDPSAWERIEVAIVGKGGAARSAPRSVRRRGMTRATRT